MNTWRKGGETQEAKRRWGAKAMRMNGKREAELGWQRRAVAFRDSGHQPNKVLIEWWPPAAAQQGRNADGRLGVLCSAHVEQARHSTALALEHSMWRGKFGPSLGGVLGAHGEPAAFGQTEVQRACTHKSVRWAGGWREGRGQDWREGRHVAGLACLPLPLPRSLSLLHSRHAANAGAEQDEKKRQGNSSRAATVAIISSRPPQSKAGLPTSTWVKTDWIRDSGLPHANASAPTAKCMMCTAGQRELLLERGGLDLTAEPVCATQSVLSANESLVRAHGLSVEAINRGERGNMSRTPLPRPCPWASRRSHKQRRERKHVANPPAWHASKFIEDNLRVPRRSLVARRRICLSRLGGSHPSVLLPARRRIGGTGRLGVVCGGGEGREGRRGGGCVAAVRTCTEFCSIYTRL